MTEGDLFNCSLIIVGESPGRTEIEKGRPFVGPAGNVLNKVLMHAGINRKDCYLTNVLPFFVQLIETVISFNSRAQMATFTPEFEYHRRALIEMLKASPCSRIVALGNVAMYALTGKIGIMEWRGTYLTNPELPGKWIVPTIHPSAVLRAIKTDDASSDAFTGKAMTYVMIHDFMKAMEGLEVEKEQINYILDPDESTIKAYIETCYSSEVISLDLETHRKSGEITVIGVSANKQSALSCRAEFLPLFKPILENPAIVKLGHNLVTFDAIKLLDYGIKMQPIEDTMVASRIALPDLPASLQFITSLYTRFPYYKYLRKVEGLTEEYFWYNAQDALMPHYCMPKIKAIIKELGNLSIYNHITRLIPFFIEMGTRGMRLDVDGLYKMKTELEEEVNNLKLQFESLCGQPINPNSPKQVATYFFGKLGLTPYKSGSVDAVVLKRLSRKGIKEATILLEYRKKSKLLSTYLNEAFHEDGRLRCIYDPVGATTGRISSKKTLDGKGLNFQNLPKEFKKFVIPDEGYKLYELDLKQAENKIVAYIAPEPKMIHAFETGCDLHSLTGSFISGLSYEEVVEQHKNGVLAPIGIGNRTWRQWGKQVNHALNYGLGYKKFALQQELDEKRAKELHEAAHSEYTGIRMYHKWVKQALDTTGKLTNLMGRTRYFLDDTMTKAYAYIPQSSIADIINIRGLRFIQERYANKVIVLNQIHDAILLQLKEEDEYIIDETIYSLEQPLHWKNVSFIINVDVKRGLTTWGED